MLEDLIRYYFNLTIKTVDKTEDGILKIKYYLSQIKLGNAIRIFFKKVKHLGTLKHTILRNS